MDDHRLAAQLAEQAGRYLLRLRGGGTVSGAALGAEGDRIANDYLTAALAAQRPDDGLLSEENIDCPARLAKRRVWIVDPLDGTREYSEARDDWAVHVALVVDGRPAAGAVALPAQGRLFSTLSPPALLPVARQPIMLVSRTRPPTQAAALAAQLGARIVAMGSAGAKAMAVVAGAADLYYHSGGQHEWDNCAPAAVALAAGLHASRVDGSPLAYNNSDTSVPDLVIGTPELARKAVEFLRMNS